MSYNNFKPEIWAAEVNVALKKALVYAGLANRSYQGDVTPGGIVHINEIGKVSTADYAVNTDITFSQIPTASKELIVDQQKYAAVSIDDVDAAQVNVELKSKFATEIGYAFADVADQYLAGLYTQAGLKSDTYLGSLASPIEVNSANVDDYFLYLGELMSDNNVTKQGRFAVIPPWMTTKLTLSAINTITDNKPMWLSGFVGQAYGFNFYESVNTPKTSLGVNHKILAGIAGQSFAFADQINKLEAGRLEKQFGDYIKGLYVYGAKVTRPDMTAVGYVTKKAEA